MPRMFCAENSTLELTIEAAGLRSVALTHYWVDNIFEDITWTDDGYRVSDQPLRHVIHIMRETSDMAAVEPWIEEMVAKGDDCDWRAQICLTSSALGVRYRCSGGRLERVDPPSYRDEPHHFRLYWDEVQIQPIETASAAPLEDVQPVSLEECLVLRRSVLWPHAPLAASRVEGDEQAHHYGIRKNGQLICCLSVFNLSDDHYQIRKFATASAYQRQGYGSRLLSSVLAALGTGKTVVLDARLSARGFYAGFGFSAQGDVFNKRDVAYIRMAKTL